MNQEHPKTTTALQVPPRQLTPLLAAFTLVGLAALIFALALRQGRENQSGVILTATPGGANDGPTEAAVLPAAVTPSLAIAPTIAPTPQTVEHVVQPGESLSSIAILYGIDIQALLAVNGLAEDSVIVPGQTLIVPLVPGGEGAYHDVQPGETLSTIAALYGINPESIQRANNLPNPDSIYPGQRLYIPGPSREPTAPPDQPTPTPTPVSPLIAELLANGPLKSAWDRSLLEGDLEKNYPLVYEGTRFTLHYQPDTYAALHLTDTIALAEKGLETAEASLAAQLEGKFDIYVAGTLFEYPNAHLRGLAHSRERKVMILHDGSGSPIDNQYFFAHEITHLIAWNTWGQPSSAMLSEGVATSSGRQILEEGGYLPYDQSCLAIDAAGQMPSMVDLNADFQAFSGHIRDPFNYFSSACFISYLIDRYGLEPVSQVYHTADFRGAFGETLWSLNEAWRADLDAQAGDLTLDAESFYAHTRKVSHAYAYVFGNYNDTEINHLAYAMVDRARVALWQGNFAEVDRWLGEFTSLTGFIP